MSYLTKAASCLILAIRVRTWVRNLHTQCRSDSAIKYAINTNRSPRTPIYHFTMICALALLVLAVAFAGFHVWDYHDPPVNAGTFVVFTEITYAYNL